eukprot:COSAG04_NODE_21813_length_367_cov_0.574627_1_plen_108_part_10
MLVEQSIFHSNAVRQAQTQEARVPATVMAYTGFMGEDSFIGFDTGYHYFVWRIDDGPIHGLPWELCQAVADFSPHWPSGVGCANQTYRTNMIYSKTVLLPPGEHTLWT